MKRMLIILLILGVAGGMFAQDITWSGGVQTGTLINMGDSYDDPVVKGDDDDTGAAVRARLNLNVAGENWGFALGTGANIFQAEEPFFGAFQPVYNNAHGWIDFADKMIKVRAGLIDPGVWGTGGEGDWNLSSGIGTRLEVTPMGDKLNIGFFLNYGGIYLEHTRMTVKDWLLNTAFGASYNDADLMGLKVSVAMKLSPEVQEEYVANDLDPSDPNFDPFYDEYDPDTWVWKQRGVDANAAAELIFAFGINPVPVLGVLIDGHVLNLGEYGDAGLFTIYEEFTFTGVENLSAGLILGQGLSVEGVINPDKGDALAGDAGMDWFWIKPWVEYAITDSLSAGLGIPIALSAKADKDGKADGMGLSNFAMDLWGKYTVGGAFAKLGYGFNKNTDDWGGEANHYIRLLFGYEF